MDEDSNVQDQNLVNDQVAQALNDSGIDDPAAVAAATDDAAAAAADSTPVVPESAGEAEATPLISPPEGEAEPEATPAEPTAAEEPVAEDVPAAPQITTTHSPASTGSGDDDELMNVKQKALEQLSPLVDHLDLPPDQKFDTYMEILRASDDKSLVQPAFDAAQVIEDEDKKAQALLDVVNEVNYLTQDHEASK